jgi:hypothetical protein
MAPATVPEVDARIALILVLVRSAWKRSTSSCSAGRFGA